MGQFLELEKSRQAASKRVWKEYPEAALRDGLFRGKERPFCLPPEFAELNLYAGIRDDILGYFQAKEIKWHGGRRLGNHLCDSQICCANFLFPFADKPSALVALLRPIFTDLAEMLPVEDGRFVALEWIGEIDYLDEMKGRKNTKRNRGANCTSADAMVRFLDEAGKRHMVLIEWKYCESYSTHSLKVAKKSQRNRVDIYRELLKAEDCPIAVERLLSYDDLFYEPFYQLMRQQLLAHQMEKAREGGCDRVSVLHIAPEHNEDFNRVTSPRLTKLGDTATEVWETLVRPPDRFRCLSTERLFGLFPDDQFPELGDWPDFIQQRYPWALEPMTLNMSPAIVEYNIVDHHFDKMLRQVARRIPRTIREAFPTFSINQGHSQWGAHVEPGVVTFDVECTRALCAGDREAMMGIIAHELAHVFCNHALREPGLQSEYEADQVGSEWGFAKEVAVMRSKLGPPTMGDLIV